MCVAHGHGIAWFTGLCSTGRLRHRMAAAPCRTRSILRHGTCVPAPSTRVAYTGDHRVAVVRPTRREQTLQSWRERSARWSAAGCRRRVLQAEAAYCLLDRVASSHSKETNALTARCAAGAETPQPSTVGMHARNACSCCVEHGSQSRAALGRVLWRVGDDCPSRCRSCARNVRGCGRHRHVHGGRRCLANAVAKGAEAVREGEAVRE